MNHRGTLVLGTLLTAALLLAACGGAGTTSLPLPSVSPTSTTLVSGQVLEVDGSTTLLDGIVLTIPETGQSVVTAEDGSFDFGAVPVGTFTVMLDGVAPVSTVQTLSVADGADEMGGMDDAGDMDGGMDDQGDMDGGMDADHYHHGAGWQADELEDGEDADEDDVVVHRTRAREQVHIRLRLEDGEISEMQCIRETLQEREVECRMDNTDANDDPDMTGKLELESRTDRQRFKIRIENATPGQELDATCTDPDGNTEFLGTRTTGTDGECRWTYDTSVGDSLPFGVDSVEDLEDCQVQVRDRLRDTTLCEATATELPAVGTGMGPDQEPLGDQVRENARDRLHSQEPGVEGDVEMRRRQERFEERFQVQVEGLEPGRELDCYLEDGEGSGSYEFVARIRAGADGEACFEANTADGDALPGGCDQVRDMERLRIQLRDCDTGDVVLDGELPELVAES